MPSLNGHLLAWQFAFHERAIKLNVDGISPEASLKRPHEGGNCINWVVGHIVSTRHGILKMLGGEGFWPEATVAAYARGTNGAVETPLSMPDLLHDLARYGELLCARIEALDADALSAVYKDPQTMGERLAFLAFHEGYHVGQLGLLRRLSGLPGAI